MCFGIHIHRELTLSMDVRTEKRYPSYRLNYCPCGCSSVDRVLASEAKGRWFDSSQPHQKYPHKSNSYRLILVTTSFLQISQFLRICITSVVKLTIDRHAALELVRRQWADAHIQISQGAGAMAFNLLQHAHRNFNSFRQSSDERRYGLPRKRPSKASRLSLIGKPC